MLVPYALWAGYGYNGQKRMAKVGDRWTTVDGERFSLIAGDYDWQWDSRVDSSHPDALGVMVNQVLENELMEGDIFNKPWTLARWWNTTNGERGLIDLNHAYEDGSVVRLERLERRLADERITMVPPVINNYESYGPTSYLKVPK